jgi:hypothetical protein
LADNLAIGGVKGSEKVAAGRCFIVHHLVVVEITEYLYGRVGGLFGQYFLNTLP